MHSESLPRLGGFVPALSATFLETVVGKAASQLTLATGTNTEDSFGEFVAQKTTLAPLPSAVSGHGLDLRSSQSGPTNPVAVVDRYTAFSLLEDAPKDNGFLSVSRVTAG